MSYIESKERSKQWREKNKERIKKDYQSNRNGIKTRKKLREKKNRLVYYLEKSGLQCERCDENHISCLEFHHTDRTKKEYNISTLSKHSFKHAKEEMEKCIVLCSNCHRKEHWDDDKIEKLERDIEQLTIEVSAFSNEKYKQCRICSKIENETEFVKGRLFCTNCYKEHQREKMKTRRTPG